MTTPRPEHTRVGEAATFRPCPRCRRHVLVAVSGGLLIRADPENLGVAGELAARLQNRLTFGIYLLGLPRRMYLEYRGLVNIRAPGNRPVVAEHRCDGVVIARPSAGEGREIVVSYGKPLPDIPLF